MTKMIHRKKLFGGRKTAEEVHQQYAFPIGAKCAGCGRRPLIRAIVMMEMKEALKNPAVSMMAQISPGDLFKNIVQIKNSEGKPTPYFRCSVCYACKDCSREMEKQLAKAPSHAIVEINRGPGVDKIVTGPGM